MKPNVGDKLYYKLPEIYRRMDAQVKTGQPLPLKRFLQVMAVGLNFLENKIEGLENIYDLDRCPVEFLPYIVESFGFRFPYALPEADQRRFTKVLPHLYKSKGKASSFEYLAREIFGEESTIKAYKQEYKEGMSPEDYKKIFVELETKGEQLYLGRKENYFRSFAELVRPLNTIIVIMLNIMYYDKYNTDLLLDQENFDIIEDIERYEKYRYRMFIDGKLTDLNPNNMLISPDSNFSFIINKSKLYKNQLVELVDTIKEEILVDKIIVSPLEEGYLKSRLNDNRDPFHVNRGHLNRGEVLTAYKELYEIIESLEDNCKVIVRDNLNKDFISEIATHDSYRYSFTHDGVCSSDRNDFLLTTQNPFFLTNKGKLTTSKVVNSGDKIKEEVLTDLVTENTISDKYSKVIRDSNEPITTNGSKINSLNNSFMETKNCEVSFNVEEEEFKLKNRKVSLLEVITDSFTDKYNDISINNTGLSDIKSSGILSTRETGFKLNSSKLFNGDKISNRTISISSCDSVLDKMSDVLNRKMKDGGEPVIINGSLINSLNHGLVELNRCEVTISPEEEKASFNFKEEVLQEVSETVPDKYKATTINGTGFNDLENSSILSTSKVGFVLNKSKTLGKEDIKFPSIEYSSLDNLNYNDGSGEVKRAQDNKDYITLNKMNVTRNLMIGFDKGTVSKMSSENDDSTTRKISTESFDSFGSLDSDRYTNENEYDSSTEITYTRIQSKISCALSRLNSFYTNDSQYATHKPF